MRDGEQLVTALGKLQKGVVGKYKLEQIERGKINVNQPIESQIEGLEDILAMADIEDAKQKYINSTKDTHGHYPLDIETKIAEFETAQNDPLKYPQYFKEGDRFFDDSGVEYVLHNGEWRER